MQIRLGEQLRTLRRRDGRTQEELAQALGVTPQAVSRWETALCFPDMALIPSIANYFGVSIDELFGYQNGRDGKIDAILRQVDGFHIKGRADGEWVDECLGILRGGLAEFPQNERLRIALADTLSEAGWRRYHEWVYYDEEGYLRHDYDRHRENPYWTEAVELCESLADTAADRAAAARAVSILVLLYRNLGETEKAAACANRMPELESCREVLLAAAADGPQGAAYTGELLLKLAAQFSRQLVNGLRANRSHLRGGMAVEAVKGAVSLFGLLCGDGNLGKYHGDVISLSLYLSRLQWECGDRDGAFASLDEALRHARALEAAADGEERCLTAPLVSRVKYRAEPCGGIAAALPEDWPFWHTPDDGRAAREIKADPRWADWVKRCRAPQQ